VNPLDQLAAEIAEAHRLGLIPGVEAVTRWHELATAAVTELRGAWMSEPDFRLRTGASAKWCRAQFRRYAREGLAKMEKSRRWWHASVRPLRRRPETTPELVEHIASTFRRSA
jgi:hypothetical protein